jgi:hypothetical protein
MAETWFSTTNINYPPVIIALMEGIRYFYYQLLYADKLTYEYTSTKTDPTEKAIEEARFSGKKRFILTDIRERALQDASRIFQISGAEFPFTAFNYDDDNLRPETYSYFADSKLYISETFNCKISVRPMKLVIPMISFFTTGFDYFRAISILVDMSSKKTLINIPIMINGVATTFPAVINLDSGVMKGQYAWEFAQQLLTGKIQDLQHDTTIFFNDIILETEGLYPVDEIDVFIGLYEQYNGEDFAPGKRVTGANIMPESPEIVSTSPLSGSLFNPTSGSLVINFNTAMNEDSVEDKIYVDPFTSLDFVWNSDSTSVTLVPTTSLLSGTLYSVTISSDIESSNLISMIDDYDFTFTTGS